MKTQDTKPPKKTYRKPAIRTYGDIRKLTRNLGATGMNDKGSGSGTMTGL